MKIIGKTKAGFILEASEHELSNLVGYHSITYWEREGMTEEQRKRYGGSVQVGDDICISAMYQSLTQMATLEKRMADARGILNTVAGGLTMVDPIIRAVNEAISAPVKE